MSATGRSAETGHVRDPDDFYKTPAWATRAILPFLPLRGRIFEPAAGTGAIVEAIREYKPDADVFGVELNGKRADVAEERLTAKYGPRNGLFRWVANHDGLSSQHGRADLIITNPPYNVAMDFAKRFVPWTKEGSTLALLLRLNWLGSEDRSDWIRANTPATNVLPKRPPFVASITCEKKKDRAAPCSFHVTQEVEAPRPKKCPACGAGVKVTTTDATEYAWMVWEPGGAPLVRILEVQP